MKCIGLLTVSAWCRVTQIRGHVKESELLGSLSRIIRPDMVISSRSTGYAKRFIHEAHAPGKRFNDYRDNIPLGPKRVRSALTLETV